MSSSRALVILIPAASCAGLVSPSPLTPSGSRLHQGISRRVASYVHEEESTQPNTPETEGFGEQQSAWGHLGQISSPYLSTSQNNASQSAGNQRPTVQDWREIHPGPALPGPRTPPTISPRRNHLVSAARLHPHSEFRAWFLFDSIIETEPSAQQLPNQFCLRC